MHLPWVSFDFIAILIFYVYTLTYNQSNTDAILILLCKYLPSSSLLQPLTLLALKDVQQKLLFKIYVVKDNHLVFMTEIPCMNDFVQKSPCFERLPATCDQQSPDFVEQSHSSGV